MEAGGRDKVVLGQVSLTLSFLTPFITLCAEAQRSCTPVTLSQGRDGSSHAKMASCLVDPLCFPARMLPPCYRADLFCSLLGAQLDSPATERGSEDGQPTALPPAHSSAGTAGCSVDPSAACAAARGRRVRTGCCCFHSSRRSPRSGRAVGRGFPVSSVVVRSLRSTAWSPALLCLSVLEEGLYLSLCRQAL